MYLIHYILPFVIYYFVRNKTMLFGLLLGNIIDLDHIYLRIMGIVPWFGSICAGRHFWNCGSFGVYPLHSVYVMITFLILSVILFFLMKKDKKLKITQWMFWISMGVSIHFILDFIHFLITASLP